MKKVEAGKVAYFRLDGGSSRLYTQEYVDKKDKVINDLLKRISDLEFEVERLEKVVNKTIESVQEHYDNSYSTDDVNDIGSGTYDDLMEILKGEDKE